MLPELLRKNRFFFLPYALMLIGLGMVQLLFSQAQLMQWINVRNSWMADQLFPYITYLGDGAAYVLVCVLLLVYNWRIGLMGLASFALSSLTSQFLKTVVFANSPRPKLYFEHSTFPFHLVDGLEIHTINSFPSGHTTTAFAMFGLLALLDTQKQRGWIFLLLACLTGYSRVYLFQHFVEDAYAGSLVGIMSTLIIYRLMAHWALKKEEINQ